MTKFVLLYQMNPSAMAAAQEHFPAHVARLKAFHSEGKLLQVGPFADRSRGAMGIFTTQEACEEFMREDPFIAHGVVASHEVLEWNDMF